MTSVPSIRYAIVYGIDQYESACAVPQRPSLRSLRNEIDCEMYGVGEGLAESGATALVPNGGALEICSCLA